MISKFDEDKLFQFLDITSAFVPINQIDNLAQHAYAGKMNIN